jgi:hypothetical protein
MASASRADPVMAAAAAAALEHEAHSHGHGHGHSLHAVANHILHHGHKQHSGEHATITISADGTAAGQQQQSGAGAAADAAGKGSPFASADGQSKTAAAVLGDAGLAVAGVAKPQAKAGTTSTAIVPAGWPASGWLTCSACCQQDSTTASQAWLPRAWCMEAS